MEAAEQKVVSRALAKGLEMLQLLSDDRPRSLTELCAAIGLGKASTLRLLQTLVSTGFVSREPGGVYSARGIRAVDSADRSFVAALMEAAEEDIQVLNSDLAETVSMAVLRDDHIRVVRTLESPQHIRMSNYPDRILAPYASSLGKAISAWQSPERLQTLLQVYGIYRTTDKTITDPILIREEMARIRERGYAREYEETVPGGCCFGAPVSAKGQPVMAAISISMPSSRLTPKMEKAAPELLLKAAARVSRKLERRLK